MRAKFGENVINDKMPQIQDIPPFMWGGGGCGELSLPNKLTIFTTKLKEIGNSKNAGISNQLWGIWCKEWCC